MSEPDLVEILRSEAKNHIVSGGMLPSGRLMIKAASEIERLREAIGEADYLLSGENPCAGTEAWCERVDEWRFNPVVARSLDDVEPTP